MPSSARENRSDNGADSRSTAARFLDEEAVDRGTSPWYRALTRKAPWVFAVDPGAHSKHSVIL